MKNYELKLLRWHDAKKEKPQNPRGKRYLVEVTYATNYKCYHIVDYNTKYGWCAINAPMPFHYEDTRLVTRWALFNVETI